MTTQEKITAKALELFNNNGIEYVGMRELAAALDIRVGNLTYYFPTKDDLVMALVINLRELNTQTMDSDCATITGFLTMYEQIFRNQHLYRCLGLSFVHLVSQNPLIAVNYKETEGKRRGRLKNHIKALAKNGNLSKDIAEDTVELIISHISIIARFWLSEARISYPEIETEQVIKHYLGLLGSVFLPYATTKGKKEAERFKEKYPLLK